jgi:hypothetical protein
VTTLLALPREVAFPGLDPREVEEGPDGTVYLLHLVTPLWSLGRTYCWRHYTGWARQGNLVTRLEAHERGRGAKFTRIARQAGCTWVLARTWQGDPKLERKIKRQGGASRCCPACGIITAAERQLIRDPMGRYVTPGLRKQ